MPMRALLLTSTCLLALAASALLHATQVTIYRCTDAKGKLTLRDSPCLRGEKQQTQEMIRPRDGKPPASPAPGPYAPRTVETIRYVVRPPTATLHACLSPDGRRYFSESPQGEAPRWMPVWSPAWPAPDRSGIISPGGRFEYRGRAVGAEIGGQRRPVGRISDPSAMRPTSLPSGSRPHAPFVAVGGYWAYDACTPLAPEEACAEWSDRRLAISRRYYQAMPSERQAMDRESELLSRRIADTCGNG